MLNVLYSSLTQRSPPPPPLVIGFLHYLNQLCSSIIFLYQTHQIHRNSGRERWLLVGTGNSTQIQLLIMVRSYLFMSALSTYIAVRDRQGRILSSGRVVTMHAQGPCKIPGMLDTSIYAIDRYNTLHARCMYVLAE